MTGELWADWTTGRSELTQAIVRPENECPALLLSVWLSVDGLWRACVEFWKHYGSWASPSSFATQQLAQEWAEQRAEAIADTYPPPGGRR